MYTKEDVEFHSDHFGPRRPAVNVKVRDTLTDGYREFRKYEPGANERFTEEWIREHVSEEALNAAWEYACECGWELLQSDAEEVFGPGVKVWSEGRSGGWAVVDGLDEFDSWDAIALAKWRRFERYARLQADDVMYQVVSSCYLNEFETWDEERSELAAPDLEAVFA